MTTSLNAYFRSQQVSLQWSPILFSLAHELEGIAQAADLRLLFKKVGAGFAASVSEQFVDIETLPELNDALNDLWARTQWGWVQLQEAPDCIEIAHQFAPLQEAFGDKAMQWSIGLLEGFYQTVFQQFSASNRLQALCVGLQDDGQQIQLRLA